MTSSKMIKSLEDFEPCQYSKRLDQFQPSVFRPRNIKVSVHISSISSVSNLTVKHLGRAASVVNLGERGSKGRGRLRKNSRPQKKSNRSRAVIAQSSADSVSAQSPDGRRFYIELAATVREIRTPSEKVIQAHWFFVVVVAKKRSATPSGSRSFNERKTLFPQPTVVFKIRTKRKKKQVVYQERNWIKWKMSRVSFVLRADLMKLEAGKPWWRFLVLLTIDYCSSL